MTVSVLVTGATYVYFIAQGGAYTNSSMRVQTSFVSGKGNITGSAGYFWPLNTNSGAISGAIYIIDLLGYITARNPRASDTDYQVKPVFYLKSSALYKSGSGTFSDPYRLAI